VLNLEFANANEFVKAAREHHTPLWKYREQRRQKAKKEFGDLDQKAFVERVLQINKGQKTGTEREKLCQILEEAFREAIIEDLNHFPVRDLMAKLVPKGPGKERSGGKQSVKSKDLNFKAYPFCLNMITHTHIHTNILMMPIRCPGVSRGIYM